MKPRRAPAGWVPPGPPPAGGDDHPSADEDLSFLCGNWRIFQRRTGHRWSVDDLVTAWVAARSAPGANSSLDLGCGLGSVLMMTAWRLPACHVTGIEAISDRAAMARRSIRWNGVSSRCDVIDGDLREKAPWGPFDLITGTPPYFPPGTGTTSGKPHAEPARFETRGGVEDYTRIAMERLTERGAFVMCASALERDRVAKALPPVDLHLEVIPKVGKEPLFTVDVARLYPGARVTEVLVVRGADDQWTPQFKALRESMGLPADF